MDVRELQQREDLDGILRGTLAAAWSRQLGRAVAVEAPSSHGQQWVLHPLLGSFSTRDPEGAARRFARDRFRYARTVPRLLPQWALGTFVASRPIWLLASRAGFSVDPPIPGARSLLVVPANQRIRIFDFARRVVRAYQKNGFSKATLRTEIRVRGGRREGPFVPIRNHDAAAGWIEEPLVDGFTLARCPPWIRRRKVETSAFRRLGDWLAESTRDDAAPGDYAHRVGADLTTALCDVDARFGTGFEAHVGPWRTLLVDRAAELEELRTAFGHGDFQPGNVLIPRGSAEPLLIDWEHAGRRSIFYDRMVYALETRWEGPHPARVAALVDGEVEPLCGVLPDRRHGRSRAFALFVLEDLLWFARESLTGPYRRPSTGLRRYCERLPRLVAAAGL